jgi:lysophospholipid acyltransferase (LPLAT)-like uncharacterized protein
MSLISKRTKIIILAKLAVILLKLIRLSVKIRIVNADNNEISFPAGSIIITFWHDQQIAFAWFQEFIYKTNINRTTYCLASKHEDGLLAAKIVEGFNIKTIAGSSSRGGLEALFELKKVLNQTSVVAITPDGPRGPRHVAKRGVIKLAALTQAPIYCCSAKVSSAWYFNSWDKMFLPKPFSNITFVVKPFKTVSSDLSKEEELSLTEELTTVMNSIEL